MLHQPVFPSCAFRCQPAKCLHARRQWHQQRFGQDVRHQLTQDALALQLDVGTGPGKGIAWGCDLSYDYVKINAEVTAFMCPILMVRQHLPWMIPGSMML